MSSTKNTVKKSSSKESQTVYWMPPLSSETSEPSSQKVMPSSIREWLMSLQGDSHASPLALPAKDLEKTTHEICGPPLSSAFALYDHSSRSWKTCQLSLITRTSSKYSETWPKAGMMLNGVCYPQPKWEQRICEIGSGFLPTPSRIMILEKEEVPKERLRVLKSGRLRKTSKLKVEGSLNLAQHLMIVGITPMPKVLETLMGWPIYWTDLQPLEMDNTLTQWLGHGNY